MSVASADHTQERELVREAREQKESTALIVRNLVLPLADALERTLDRLEAAERERDVLEGFVDRAREAESALADMRKALEEIGCLAFEDGPDCRDRLMPHQDVCLRCRALAAVPGEPETQEPPRSIFDLGSPIGTCTCPSRGLAAHHYHGIGCPVGQVRDSEIAHAALLLSTGQEDETFLALALEAFARRGYTQEWVRSRGPDALARLAALPAEEPPV